jgi:lipid A 4'-phosphatase
VRLNDELKVMALQLLRSFRGWLSLRRTQVILGSFLAISLLFVAFPAVDLRFSRQFYDGGFHMADQGWARLLHASVTWFLYASMAAVAAVYVFNRLSGRGVWGIDGRKVVYLLLVLALGAGLIVNGLFKEGFGRARPRDIAEFGGAAQFTPAYAISSNCSHNCSFSNGDAAAAFFSLAFVYVARRRRLAAAAAMSYGLVVSAARITSGAHFLSDSVVSFFVMLTVADALYYRMFLFDRGPADNAPGARPEITPWRSTS